MWIKMKKNYPGGGKPIKGLERHSFLADSEYDVRPDETAKLLIKNKFAVPTVAPWEKNVDKDAVEREKLKNAVGKIENQIRDNRVELKKAEEVADSIPRLKRVIESLEQNLKSAAKQLETFAAKNNIA